MEKTFDVWVKKIVDGEFMICSKKIKHEITEELVNVAQDEVDTGSIVCGCNVSQWLETLDMEEDEVKSFKLTLKEN